MLCVSFHLYTDAVISVGLLDMRASISFRWFLAAELFLFLCILPFSQYSQLSSSLFNLFVQLRRSLPYSLQFCCRTHRASPLSQVHAAEN